MVAQCTDTGGLRPLSPREREVVEVVRNGALTYKRIRRDLTGNPRPTTVRSLVRNVAAKVPIHEDGPTLARVIAWAHRQPLEE